LELLVFHKPKKSSSSAASALATCSTITTTACQNGGTSILDNGSCACICTNGFTGPTCTVANFTGCITANFPSGTYSNVTLGTAIPRLIAEAQANFSIPLFESVILARFNAANLTCTSENALVTFDGNSQRTGGAADEALVQDSAATSSSPSSTPLPNSNPKQKHRSVSSESSYSYSYSTTPTTTPSTSSTTSTSATPTTSQDPNAAFTITQQVLDFSRVAVLFVLQQEDIDNAVTAQSELQHVFGQDGLSVGAARNLSIGGGNTVDLVEYRLNLGNGTEGGLNSTLSRRAILGRSANVNLWTGL
jgi:hypothetical protein